MSIYLWLEMCIRDRLGIEMNEAKIRAAAQQGHRWRNPVWRTEDGVVAEW